MVTNTVFESLRVYYKRYKAPIESLNNQLKKIGKQLNIEDCLININSTINKIESLYKCVNKGLVDSIDFLITNTKNDNKYKEMITCLEGLLCYQNYVDKELYVVYNWVPAHDASEERIYGSWHEQRGLEPGDSILGIVCQTIGWSVNC